MAPDCLTVDDTRVEHRLTDVGGGITYHYMLASPEKEPVATILLLHGWYVLFQILLFRGSLQRPKFINSWK